MCRKWPFLERGDELCGRRGEGKKKRKKRPRGLFFLYYPFRREIKRRRKKGNKQQNPPKMFTHFSLEMSLMKGGKRETRSRLPPIHLFKKGGEEKKRKKRGGNALPFLPLLLHLGRRVLEKKKRKGRRRKGERGGRKSGHRAIYPTSPLSKNREKVR